MGWGQSKPAKTEALVSEQDKFQLRLKVSRDRLDKYIKRTEAEIIQVGIQAKHMIAEGKRENAMRFLKIKKLKNNAMEVAMEGKLRLEHLNNELDQKQAQVQVLEGLSAGTRALEQAHSAMPLTRVESILGDASSAMQAQQEVDDLLIASSLYDPAADDASVEAALAELDASIAHADAHPAQAAHSTSQQAPQETLHVVSMPVAPSHQPIGTAQQQTQARRSTGRIAAQAQAVAS